MRGMEREWAISRRVQPEKIPVSCDDWSSLDFGFRFRVVQFADGVRSAVEAMDARTPENGARLVARAWSDPAFKARLLADGSAAAGEMGFEVGTLKLMVIENTPAVHNLVVCTLCSCYPRMLIGLPPAWYKSAAYRKRAVREPRAVLRAFGTIIPGDVEVRVHDSTADLRYMILPLRPAGTDGWSEEQLVPLVTRDSLLGVTVALAPAPHCAPSPR